METGLSLGSNQGDRLAVLSKAVSVLASLPGVTILAKSPAYETEPVGVKPEHQHLKFLNAVVIAESGDTAHEWYERARTIEYLLGRSRTLDRYAPRPIDIDLIYVGDTHIESGGLVIPHPRWAERRFVVKPLADVRPDLVLPGQVKSVAQILKALPRGKDAVKLFAKSW